MEKPVTKIKKIRKIKMEKNYKILIIFKKIRIRLIKMNRKNKFQLQMGKAQFKLINRNIWKTILITSFYHFIKTS